MTHWIASANTDTDRADDARLLARKMGARFIADPLYDPGFRRFSLPLVAALDDIPARTLQQLASLGACAS